MPLCAKTFFEKVRNAAQRAFGPLGRFHRDG
jgi:hypothetical protein